MALKLPSNTHRGMKKIPMAKCNPEMCAELDSNEYYRFKGGVK
jgi:hypothetical protein